jgi:transcriptional regulator with XRE-family HTH domain
VARDTGDSLTLEESSLAQRVGRRLRERRKERGHTLAEVAREAAVSISYLSAVEKGTNQPSLPVLARIVHALELAIADVLRAEGQNHLRREALGRAAGQTTLSHPGLQLAVESVVAEPGDTGTIPVPVGTRDVFVYVLQGTLAIAVDGGEYGLAAGDALDARSPDAISWRAGEGERASAIWGSVASQNAASPARIVAGAGAARPAASPDD